MQDYWPVNRAFMRSVINIPAGVERKPVNNFKFDSL